MAAGFDASENAVVLVAPTNATAITRYLNRDITSSLQHLDELDLTPVITVVRAPRVASSEHPSHQGLQPENLVDDEQR